MAIVFHNVYPVYLEKEKVLRSEVWNKEITFLPGKYVQVTAPSGSGKTSFVHFLYGLRNDYSGNITFQGKEMRKISAEEISSIRQRKLSVIFQDMRLFPHHSLWQNITVKHALEPFHDESRVTEMAKTLGIHTKLKQAASKCSYGEQQRAAIIRALQQPFDFLLMDEPFSHLDDNNRALAMALILEECMKRNAGILMADLEPYTDFPADENIFL